MARSTSSPPTAPGRESTVDGILVARSWSAGGGVTALALNSSDEREYRITADRETARSLARHLRKRVRVHGVFSDHRAIRVTDFTVLDDLDETERPEREGVKT